jgi:hypothetical protein
MPPSDFADEGHEAGRSCIRYLWYREGHLADKVKG